MTKVLAYLIPVLILLTGCSERRVETDSISEPVYSKQYRQHAATAIITLSETNLPTSGKIRFMVDIHAPADLSVEMPALRSAIEPFDIADGYTEPIQTLPNGKQLHRQVWVITPRLAGSAEFQPLEINVGPETIHTDPIQIRVESLLPEHTETLEIKDIAEPIALLPEQEKKRRSIYTVLGAVLILLLIPILVRLFRKTDTEELLAPHEAAFQSLENLPVAPVERIHDLNRIFRAYYEARFKIPMAGKTSVEILAILEDTGIIKFLEQCEDVRFSNKVPEGFADTSELFVRSYIERTTEPECD